MIYSALKESIGSGIVEVYGNKSTGKTTFSLLFANDALANNNKVLYINTEKALNFNKYIKQPQNLEHVMILNLDKLLKYINDLYTNGIDKNTVIILDSLGLPALNKFVSKYSQIDKGLVLQQCIEIVGKLNELATQNNNIFLITNQPESEYGKANTSSLEPFGDKHVFAVQLILSASKVALNGITTCYFHVYASQHFQQKQLLFTISIDNNGAKVTKNY